MREGDIWAKAVLCRLCRSEKRQVNDKSAPVHTEGAVKALFGIQKTGSATAMVRPDGVEPPTSTMSTWRSNQLS